MKPSGDNYRRDFPIIVTPGPEIEDMDDVKKRVKEVCRNVEDLPAPSDVVVTKARQVIIKMKSREDRDKMKQVLEGSDTLQEKTRINVPRGRKERLLLLSVDPKVEEETVSKTLRKVLDDATTEGQMIQNLTSRMRDTALTPEVKAALQELYAESTIEIDIIRQIKTGNGMINWLVETDLRGKEVLLQRRRICLDFGRYRMVEFRSIIRCFKCQQFGHYAGSCENKAQCVKCAKEHSIKDCDSTETCCSNCYAQDKDGDCEHRADSMDCPIYRDVRNRIIPMRS